MRTHCSIVGKLWENTHKSKLVVGAWHRAPDYVGSWYYYSAGPSLSQRGTSSERSLCQQLPALPDSNTLTPAASLTRNKTTR